MRESLTVSSAQYAADELLLLLPALPAAMRKDAISNGGGKRTFSSSLPVNTDVMSCAVSLYRDMHTAETHIRKHLGYAQLTDRRTIEDVARTWPVYIEALDGNKDTAVSQAITHLNDWLRRVRKAIGLTVPAKPLGRGYLCPACDSTPGRLLVLGAEGTLVKRAHAWNVDWRHGEAIWCPSCQSTWPREKWPLLGRMLNATATAETADATALAARINIPSVTVRRWATEGRITAIDHDYRARPLYDVEEVMEIARQLGRIPETIAA